MELHGDHLVFKAFATLDGVVEQVDVSSSQRGVGKRFLNDCISVVLRCDEHLTCGKLLDGMVAATMSGRDRPDFAPYASAMS